MCRRDIWGSCRAEIYMEEKPNVSRCDRKSWFETDNKKLQSAKERKWCTEIRIGIGSLTWHMLIMTGCIEAIGYRRHSGSYEKRISGRSGFSQQPRQNQSIWRSKLLWCVISAGRSTQWFILKAKETSVLTVIMNECHHGSEWIWILASIRLKQHSQIKMEICNFFA